MLNIIILHKELIINSKIKIKIEIKLKKLLLENFLKIITDNKILIKFRNNITIQAYR